MLPSPPCPVGAQPGSAAGNIGARRGLCRWLLPLAVGCAAWLSTARAETTPPRTDDIVVLPPFVVTAESLEFEGWHKAVSPHFIMYTDAPTDEIEPVLREIEVSRAAAEQLLGRPFLQAAPVILIVPLDGSDWHRLTGSGKPRTSNIVVAPTATVVMFRSYLGRLAIGGIGGFRWLYGLHVADFADLPKPEWFEYGLPRLLGNARVEGDKMTIGVPDGLRPKYWREWEDFLSAPRPDPYSKEATPFDDQSQAFCHALLASPDAVTPAQLERWLRWLEAGNPPSREDFRLLVGKDRRTFERHADALPRLRRSKHKAYSRVVTVGPEAIDFKVAIEPAKPREMRELCVLVEIMHRPRAEAHAALEHILRKGLKTESLGGLLAGCLRHDQKPEALAQLRGMIAAGSTVPQIYLEAAQLLFDQQMPAVTLDARFGPERAEIQTYCGYALALEPNYSQPRGLFAWTEALGESVGPENVAAIARLAQEQRPASITDSLVAAHAVASWRSGDLSGARGLAEELVKGKIAHPPMRALAEALLARLPPVAAPTR